MNKFSTTSPNTMYSRVKNSPNKYKAVPERKIIGLNLKNPKIQESYHSSIMMSDRNSSMRNVVDTTYNQSQISIKDQMSQSSFQFISQSKLKMSSSLRKSQKKLEPLRASSRMKEVKSPGKQKTRVQLQDVFKKYYDTNFIQTLLNFTSKDWTEEQEKLLQDKRFESLKNVIVQKTSDNNQLIEQFFNLEYDKYEDQEKKLILSVLFKQTTNTLKDYENIFGSILHKIPEDKLIKQQNQLEEMQKMILEMFDVKFLAAPARLKERYDLFIDGYTHKKNNLIVGVATKLKSNLQFIIEIQNHLFCYQKELLKIKNQFQVAETEKRSLQQMLKKKVNFAPVQLDFVKFQQLKDESKKQFFEDLENNFVVFHEKQHKKNLKKITSLQEQNVKLTTEIEELKEKNKKLQEELQFIRNSVPKKKDAQTQVFLIASKGVIQQYSALSKIGKFLQNVSTPFTFTQKITSSVINLMSIDKILYDYERIRNKQYLKSYQDFMLQWFVIRTGSKKIAQILTKNFMFSIKQLKGRHKRFNIFAKMCGFNGFRKKNIQQDLEYIYFQTHQAWYYLLKLALAYRKKLNDNPTGYHLFPPIQCEEIFKLPLRKVYEVIDEFFENQEIQVPADLHNKIDYYAINEISKYKSHDEKFQKQQLQQIHILRQINFDIIAGFVIEYIAHSKCTLVEKLLKSINLKQKQSKQVLGYSEFQAIYKRYFKQKRSKIEQVYSQICVTNQYDMLDIENTESIVRYIVEDERGLRNSFDEFQSLKVLILADKTVLKADKRIQQPNSYENFRQRFYYEFYDFFNATNYLEEMYKIIKGIIKKKLKAYIKDQAQIDSLIAEKQPIALENNKKETQEKDESSDEDDYSDEEGSVPASQQKKEEEDKGKRKIQLENKINQWFKISTRIPHFSQKILTIDQIIVHNMRRRQMIEATEFAWKTMRQILIMISKE